MVVFIREQRTSIVVFLRRIFLCQGDQGTACVRMVAYDVLLANGGRAYHMQNIQRFRCCMYGVQRFISSIPLAWWSIQYAQHLKVHVLCVYYVEMHILYVYHVHIQYFTSMVEHTVCTTPKDSCVVCVLCRDAYNIQRFICRMPIQHGGAYSMHTR